MRRTTTQRGYGREHAAARAVWRRVVEAGGATCARCGLPLEPGEPWDLDHADDRDGYLGPSHPRCNRRAGGRRGGIVSGRRRRARGGRAWSREWY